jgi:pyridoxamine 5'-phosphate oxidase
VPRLAEADLASDPVTQFRGWLDEASAAGLREPTAAALATSAADGKPSVRMVLLKSVDDRGFVFATNYESRKGRELSGNPWASLLFYWDALERQVRVEGAVARTDEAESDAIFHARPRGARQAAWASRQSRVIPDRRHLDERLEEIARRYPGELPRPPFWGGYRLAPERVEFWQGVAFRLHDRLRYVLAPDGGWRVERLAP